MAKRAILPYVLGGAALLGVIVLARRSSAQALAPSPSVRTWPVVPNRGTISGFGAPRPAGKYPARYHAAVDVGAQDGDKVVAIDDGEVLKLVTGYQIGAGLQAVAIRHPDADYIYAEIQVTAVPGQRVKAGDVIGVVRQNDSGPGHQMLHLEAWQTGMVPDAFKPWYVGQAAPPGLLDVGKILAPLANTGVKP
jgi:murein DD-endopeptidase MepM/ murein hydrolase activator NlpD